MQVGPSEAEPFWTDFLRSLMRRGLRGVKLVISDAHEGLKAAVAKVFHATWQRCRVHFMRNAMAHVGKGQRSMVAALLRTVFAQDSRAECHQQWRLVADQLREKYPKIAVLMDGCEDGVLAHMAFPQAHRQQLHSTNPLERLNAEIKRRTDVVGIFPNDPAITRLVGSDAAGAERRMVPAKALHAVGGLRGCQRSAGQAVGRDQLKGKPSGQSRDELHHFLGHDPATLLLELADPPKMSAANGCTLVTSSMCGHTVQKHPDQMSDTRFRRTFLFHRERDRGRHAHEVGEAYVLA